MLDASTLVSAALTQNGTARLAVDMAWSVGRIAVSRAVFNEITGVLARPKFAKSLTPGRRLENVERLATSATWFEPAETVTDCRDPKDNCYLELALAARAAALVTGDSDLLELHPWRTVRVVRPAQFLAMIGGGEL